MDGKELKALRVKLGLSQVQMAEKLYITAGAVSRLEADKNTMSRQTAALVAQLEPICPLGAPVLAKG